MFAPAFTPICLCAGCAVCCVGGLGAGLILYAVGKVRYFAAAIDFFNQAGCRFQSLAFFGEAAREFEVVHDFFVEDFAWDE